MNRSWGGGVFKISQSLVKIKIREFDRKTVLARKYNHLCATIVSLKQVYLTLSWQDQSSIIFYQFFSYIT